MDENANLKDKDEIEGDYLKLDGDAPDLESEMVGHALQKKKEKNDQSSNELLNSIVQMGGGVGKFATQGIGSIIKAIISGKLF